MKLNFGLALLVLVALLTSGCEERVQPFYNPSNVPIPKSLTFTPLNEIGDTIKRAGVSRAWEMTDEGPGKMKGVLKIRNHKATIRVDYSTISYSITYVSSINLMDNGAGIHRNYNTWIRELESSINAYLQAFANSTKNEVPTTEDRAMMEAWARAENSNDPLELQDFLEKYGDGPFAILAQKRLEQLTTLRTGDVRKFDPTGKWRVVITYVEDNGNPSRCARKQTWSFTLDFQRGKINRTITSGKALLYVTGENMDDYVNLNFDYPDGGGEWKWTEKFALDQNEKRATLISGSGGSRYGCAGRLGVYMKKLGAEGDTTGTSLPYRHSDVPVSAQPNGFDPTGKWRVTATYKSSSGASSSCIQNVTWNFILDFHQGKISETFYSGRTALYVSGGNSPGYVNLEVNVPAGGSLWKWAERFNLDGPDKFFRAESPSGGGIYGQCHGIIGFHMTKMDEIVSKKTPPPVSKVEEAEKAWLAIKDSADEEQLRSYLKKYIDSEYAELAIARLNTLLTFRVGNASFTPIGKWKVTTTYKGHNGNAAYCPNGEKWEFLLNITGRGTSDEVWSGKNALYVTGKSENNTILLSFDVPRGGSNWQWSEPFKLDQKQKHFLAEAKQQGGAYGGCSGMLYVLMTKLN